MAQVNPRSTKGKSVIGRPTRVAPPRRLLLHHADPGSAPTLTSAELRCVGESSETEAYGELSEDRLIGAQFGNFRVLRKLCEGGMGVVYEGKHLTIERRAVIKVMHGKYAQNPNYAERFLNEARAVNIIGHPGLVEIFDYGKRSDGTLFIVMEFLQGESLQDRMNKRVQAFPENEVLALGIQLARTLTAAHGKGVIHRDLKPDNIMLVPDPITQGQTWAKIIDFGIAKLGANVPAGVKGTDRGTLPDSILGTPMYMAPEQFGQAQDVDGRADVFSLGVILFGLLAGQPPYIGSSFSLLRTPALPLGELAPEGSTALVELIEQMIAVAATERPAMAEVASQLAAMPSRDPGTSPSLELPPPARSRHLLALAGVVVSLGAILLPRLLATPQLGAHSEAAPARSAVGAPALDPVPSADPSRRSRFATAGNSSPPEIAADSSPDPPPPAAALTLPAGAAVTPPSADSPAPAPSPLAGSPQAERRASHVGKQGYVKFVGERFVRVQIDYGTPQTLPGTPVRLAAGIHTVRYAGGAKRIAVTANHTVAVRIPVTYVQQLRYDVNARTPPGRGGPRTVSYAGTARHR